MNKLSQLLIIITIAYACSTEDDAITTLNIKGKEIPYIDLQKVTDSIPVKFTDFLEDFQFIKIENRKDLPVARGNWYSNGKHLLYTNYGDAGLLQFDMNGKFVRELAKKGKGPKELFFPNLCFSTDGNIVAVSDYNRKTSLLCINLNDGTFKENIPLSKKGQFSKFCYNNENNLVFMPSPNQEGKKTEAGEFCILEQNEKGLCLNTESKRSGRVKRNVNTGYLCLSQGVIYFRPIACDTIYSYTRKSLHPIYIIKALPRNLNPKSPEDGIGDMRSRLIYQNNNYVLIRFSEIIECIKSKSGNGFRYSFKTKGHKILFDLKTRKAKIIKPFYDDLMDQEKAYFSNHFNSNYHIKHIDAISFLELAEKAKTSRTINPKAKKQILELAEGYTENDNPIILIGKIKEEINF